MRKINKIMMATVSILLTLVLISSCVLSGIFAKYVTSKTASSQMQFEKFGAILTLEVPETQKTMLENDYGATVTVPVATSNAVKSGVYSVKIENLKMGPDDNLNNILHFHLEGTANVPCKLTIDVTFDYNTEAPSESNGNNLDTFYIPKVDGGKDAGAYFPIKVVCKATGANYSGNYNCLTPWLKRDAAAKSNSTVHQVLAKNFDLKCNSVGEDGYTPSGDTEYVYKEFKVDDPVTLYKRKSKGYDTAASTTAVNDLYFSLQYAYEYTDDYTKVAESNAMGTYLAQNRDATFSVTFVFTITQTA